MCIFLFYSTIALSSRRKLTQYGVTKKKSVCLAPLARFGQPPVSACSCLPYDPGCAGCGSNGTAPAAGRTTLAAPAAAPVRAAGGTAPAAGPFRSPVGLPPLWQWVRASLTAAAGRLLSASGAARAAPAVGTHPARQATSRQSAPTTGRAGAAAKRNNRRAREKRA